MTSGSQKYALVIHRAEEGGYWAEAPSLPGCFAQGETPEDVRNEMRAAIASHIEALLEDGQSTPKKDVFPSTMYR